MFRVGDVILSEEIATRKFACNISRCKGACCVVGESGAPVDKGEIPVLNKAFRKLKGRLTSTAIEEVERHGVVQKNDKGGYEITCVPTGECIFVEKSDEGIATCAIQNAFYKGEFGWEKPISCHLYPIRLKRIAGMEYANFEYIPELCSGGCLHGSTTGTYLSDFLKPALTRRFGEEWVRSFEEACHTLRMEAGHA
ncbi:MAG: DUF3109 family protein [Balneolaceae bacterium]